MFKNILTRKITIVVLILLLSLIVCFFPKNINIDEEIIYHKEKTFPIFLIDNKNYVARTSIAKSNLSNNDIIKEIIDILTIDSIKSSYIPFGFRAIIPKGTKLLDTKLNNKILTLNFSKEILNIKQDNEEKLIESLLYSLTEIKDIDKISLLIEGNPLNQFLSGRKIPKVIDKSYGINKTYNINSIKNISKTTIYYLSKIDNYYYYVPVTIVDNNNNEKI